jgi:hypothetical protein
LECRLHQKLIEQDSENIGYNDDDTCGDEYIHYNDDTCGGENEINKLFYEFDSVVEEESPLQAVKKWLRMWME